MAVRAYVITSNTMSAKGASSEIATVATQKRNAIQACESILKANGAGKVEWTFQNKDAGQASFGQHSVSYQRFKIYEG